MFKKEEVKEIKTQFWNNFRDYCKTKKIRRRWLMNNISVKSSQLKFDANRECAIVGIQIDNKKVPRKYLIFSYWKSYRILIEELVGEPLIWERDYLSNDNRFVSMAFLKLNNVDYLNTEDYEKIYDFFIEKMILFENVYLEIGDSIIEGIKNKS